MKSFPISLAAFICCGIALMGCERPEITPLEAIAPLPQAAPTAGNGEPLSPFAFQEAGPTETQTQSYTPTQDPSRRRPQPSVGAVQGHNPARQALDRDVDPHQIQSYTPTQDPSRRRPQPSVGPTDGHRQD